MAIQLVFLGFHHVIEYKLSSTHLAGLGTATITSLNMILKSLYFFFPTKESQVSRYFIRRSASTGTREKRGKDIG